jgi:hypothetical protein
LKTFKTKIISNNAMMLMNACWFLNSKPRDVTTGPNLSALLKNQNIPHISPKMSDRKNWEGGRRPRQCFIFHFEKENITSRDSQISRK